MDELLSEFVTETSESLSFLDSELIKLEQEPNNAEILSNIFRLMHTIKGTCGFLGLSRLESIAHASENVLGKIRDDEIQVNQDIISVILKSIDTIRELVEHLEDEGEEPGGDDSDLINNLNKYIDGSTVASVGSAEAVEAVSDSPAEQDQAASSANSNDDLTALQEIADEPDEDEESSDADDSDDLQALFDETEFDEAGLAELKDPTAFEADSDGEGQTEADSDAEATSNIEESETDVDDSDDLQALFDETEFDEAGLAELKDPTAFEADSDGSDAAAAVAEPAEEAKTQEPEPVAEAPAAEAPAPEAAAAKPASTEKKTEKNAATPKKDDKDNLANQSIRVNLGVLEKLMQMVGELVLTRNQLMQLARRKNDADMLRQLQQLSLITSDLQDNVMQTRMQPISGAWNKFPRIIRDMSVDLGKKIDLQMVGQDTELDRQILEVIKDPLTHMVRNSCDHGLEGPEERAAAGKSETGTIILRAYHEGGHIIIEIEDNGRGVNIEKVKEKAISNGIASEEELETLSENQIVQYIFKPGFSTAEKVTNISGRGVGMDVVRTNIEKIGGTVELSSKFGQGSKFSIKIPLTLAIASVLIVEASNEKFAIPQLNVTELVKAGKDRDYKVEMVNNSPVLRLRDQLLPLISLAEMFEWKKQEAAISNTKIQDNDSTEQLQHQAANDNDPGEMFIVVCKVGGTYFGVIVDQIYDTEEIVVKPVSKPLREIDIYSGNTILGDGSVVMILDPNGLARSSGDSDSQKEEEVSQEVSDAKDSIYGFLVFDIGDSSPKAVPLELISRLEEIENKEIEYSNGKPVIQYRGSLMCLQTLENMQIPEDGTSEVIVFTYDDRTIGLVVRSILDIVRCKLNIQYSSGKPGYLGSMVISEKTTDVIDVTPIVSDGNEIEIRKSANSMKILFAEDSPFFINLTVPFLKALGHEVESYKLPQEALDNLENHSFDLVITDIEMPQMDGFQLAQELGRIDSMKNVPVVAFTSTVNEHVKQKADDVGMVDIIPKNNRDKLVEVIEKHNNIVARKKMADENLQESA